MPLISATPAFPAVGAVNFNALAYAWALHMAGTFTNEVNALPTIVIGTGIDNTPIGATTRNTGAFTTLSTTGQATIASAQFTSTVNPASGSGVEVGLNSGNGVVQSVNRTGGVYLPLFLNGLSVAQQINGATVTSVTAGGLAVTGAVSTTGNVGVGVTSGTWSTGNAIEVGNVYAKISASGTYGGVFTNNAVYNASWKYEVSNYATMYQTIGGVHSWHNAPSGTAGNAITFTQAMTLTAAGNLLVGKTVPTFTTDGVSLGNAGSNFSYTSASAMAINRNGTDGIALEFYKAGVLVGNVSVTGTTTTYNTSSDYRLKNITGPVTDSGAYIDSLNPVQGTWKADGSTFVGLLAHEVQEASRTPVATGTKDGAEMQAMDYSSSEIIANLIAELQSLRARVAQLEGI